VEIRRWKETYDFLHGPFSPEQRQLQNEKAIFDFTINRQTNGAKQEIYLDTNWLVMGSS